MTMRWLSTEIHSRIETLAVLQQVTRLAANYKTIAATLREW